MDNNDVLIRGGRVIDPANGLSGEQDVWVRNGRIEAVDECGSAEPSSATVIDAKGSLVIPGLVDTHVHLSEPFGGPQGFRMLARAGVTCALDMAGVPDSLVDGIKSDGAGITVGFVYPVIPGGSVADRDPGRTVLAGIRDHALDHGALGLKLLGGHYPLSGDATALAIRLAADAKCWCAVHCGTMNNGSDIAGLEELLALAEGLPVHVAHINSYCRGQHTGNPLEEAMRAIEVLSQNPNARSESYLATINGANAKQLNGIPISNVVKTCLKLGGFPATETGMKDAIRAGWAQIQGLRGGETTLLPPEEGMAEYEAKSSDVGVSFAVNPPASAIAIALARKDRDFVVTAISTDGGAIPRNSTIEQGLALVEFGALTIEDFVRKSCFNPARMFGLGNKGHLSPGADADIAVVDPLARRATWVLAEGRIIVKHGEAIGRSGKIATTARGLPYLANKGIEGVVATPDWI